MNIAIFPARIGSKRIQKKNIKKFHGKPIILWTLDKIIKFNIFDKIIISSDSEKVFKTIKRKNIFFHKRDSKYSNDQAKTIDVIKSCINKFNINLKDNVCCIYPCAVFFKKKHLLDAFKLMNKNLSKFVLPVVKYDHPIERSFTLSHKKEIMIKSTKKISKITQQFKPSYHDTGQFYWAKTKTWVSCKDILSNSIAVEILNEIIVDIDDKDTWKKALGLFKMNYLK